MDSLTAFCMGEAHRDREQMVFDWKKAAELIREHQPNVASAGLCGDWEYTGVDIYRDGKPVTDSYVYLASTWATPEIQLDDDEAMPCFLMASETPGWDDTKWPEEALEILTR